MSNHDDHYRRIKAKGIEPILMQESIICQSIPEEYHAIAKRNLSLAQAVRYIARAGEKDQETADIEKAENYLHRARTGKWRGQGNATDDLDKAEEARKDKILENAQFEAKEKPRLIDSPFFKNMP
jgi:hypothetical protein